MNTRETKKLIYKLGNGAPAKRTIQSALMDALKRYGKVKTRMERLGADASQVRFVNFARMHQGITVGLFHKVTQGAGQYIIDMDDSSDAWKVQLVPAGIAGPNIKREFVEGSLYFAVWGNHVVMHQTNACRADQFESYCSWLLSKAASNVGEVGTEILVSFNDPLPPDVRRQSRVPVKGLKFGGTVKAGMAGSQSQARRAQVHFTPKGGVWNGLKSILREIGADISDDILLDEALGDGDVTVSLQLSCSKKRAESSAGQLLTAIGRSLRHAEDTKFSVELADGTEIRADQMKIDKDVRVECVQKQPVIEPLFRAMVDWFPELLNNGYIVEDEEFGNVR